MFPFKKSLGNEWVFRNNYRELLNRARSSPGWHSDLSIDGDSLGDSRSMTKRVGDFGGMNITFRKKLAKRIYNRKPPFVSITVIMVHW